jgi:hypothetical protein
MSYTFSSLNPALNSIYYAYKQMFMFFGMSIDNPIIKTRIINT